MNSFNDVLAGDTSPLKKLEQALQKEAVGGKRKKEADFAEAYPVIEQHLARKVPVKVVIETFGAAYGYAIHAPRFRSLLEAERKRRTEAGDVVVCSTCGHQLVSTTDVPDVADSTEDEQ